MTSKCCRSGKIIESHMRRTSDISHDHTDIKRYGHAWNIDNIRYNACLPEKLIVFPESFN